MLTEAQKTVAVNISSSGDNTIITAPAATAAPGAYIAVDFMLILPTTAVTVTFKSGATSISGPLPLDAKQAITIDNANQAQYGTIKCGANENFIINLGGAVQVGGWINYRICNY